MPPVWQRGRWPQLWLARQVEAPARQLVLVQVLEQPWVLVLVQASVLVLTLERAPLRPWRAPEQAWVPLGPRQPVQG